MSVKMEKKMKAKIEALTDNRGKQPSPGLSSIQQSLNSSYFTNTSIAHQDHSNIGHRGTLIPPIEEHINKLKRMRFSSVSHPHSPNASV